MADQQQRTQKKRREIFVLDDRKLWLFAPALQEAGRQVSLKVKKIENNPGIEVDLGIKTEPKNGKEGYPIKIETPMEPKSFRNLMNLIIKIAQYKGPVAFEMENWGHPFIWDNEQRKNVRSKDRLIISRFSVGKREDGTVFFGVAAKGKTPVEFEFKSDEFHPVMQNGQKVQVNIDSPMAAQAWAETMIDVVCQDYGMNWEEPEYQKQRRLEYMQRAQGGGGGNNQYRGNNGGNGGGGNNYNQRPQQPQQQQQSNIGGGLDSFDESEDIPF